MDTSTKTMPGATALARGTGEGEAAGQEYLVFRLADQEYGVDILKVQEIRSYGAQAITHVPNAPAFIKGVTNLRGMILPIVDLRIRLGLEHVEYTSRTAVVVLALSRHRVGVVVDGVSDVQILEAAQVSSAPSFVSRLMAEHLAGIGTLDDRMLLLVDIEGLMASAEMAVIDSAATAPQETVG